MPYLWDFTVQSEDEEESSSDENSNKGPATKVLWYLPIIPRFKRLFAIEDDAKDLTWHANGMISADCLQWKKMNGLYLYFGKESRNLRLGIASDGMMHEAKIHDVVYDDIGPKTAKK